MEDHDPNSPRHGSERNEPVRSRWTPKPEQILILESIFNSGMVNPPKDETVRIRKLLEKFGSVGDANVFYWFQNRRSRSRRRQRQIQASLVGEKSTDHHHLAQQLTDGGGAIQYQTSFACTGSFSPSPTFTLSPSSCLAGSSSSSSGVNMGEDGVNDFFSISNQMGLPDMEHSSAITSILCPSDTSNVHYQSGFITVFINGVATEVPRGALDMKAMFGQDFVLVHSSGMPVPFNEYGFTMQSLQHGESYFLVSRTT
nr:WUSCHEL-like homeobox 11 [Paeonia suffruticosa]